MTPARKQRLFIIFGILAAISVAVALIGVAMQENINLFFSPKQIVAGEAPQGQRIRVGGLVVTGTVRRGEGLDVRFDITDQADTITVQYDGILPDLFREGQGIIAAGKLQADGRTVLADEVLAKHDENYMPPEVQDAIEKAGHPGETVQKPQY